MINTTPNQAPKGAFLLPGEFTEGPITVEQLIAQLKCMPPLAPVYIYEGPVHGVHKEPEKFGDGSIYVNLSTSY